MKRLFTVRNLVILLAIVALYVVSGLLGLKVASPEVSIAAEPVFHIGSFAITNSLFTAWVVMILLIIIAYAATRRIPRDLNNAPNSALVPKGFQNAFEWAFEYLYKTVQDVAGHWTATFFPIVMTIFLFVILSNWIGLVPGFGSLGVIEPAHEGVAGFIANGRVLTAQPATQGNGSILVPLFRSPSTDLNFTLALALIAVGLSEYFGLKTQRIGYLKRFFDTSGFKQNAFMGIVQFIAGILELIGEFARVISFSFRLFGNIFAGEVLLAVIAFLLPYVASLPFYGLEVFVGFIQAVVFMMLALVFFTTATIGHSAEEQHS